MSKHEDAQDPSTMQDPMTAPDAPIDMEVIDIDSAFHQNEGDPYAMDGEGLAVLEPGDNVLIETDDLDLGGGKHAKPDQPEYMRKSRRMRKILIAVIIVLVVLIAAGVVLGYQLFQTANVAAEQQTLAQANSSSTFTDESATKDASTTTAKTTTVPNLVSLLGLTTEQAIEAVGHGATVTSSVEVNEEGNPIRSEVRLGLTSEQSDTKSGTPTVYLSLDEGGIIIQSGYSVSTSALGYGSLSFSDALTNEHLIEKTLTEAGLSVENGSVVLPEDKMVYSSYGSDGTTLTKENCSFEGVGTASDGATLPWSAILTYDYTTANATGNLADTIRTVYVYVASTSV